MTDKDRMINELRFQLNCQEVKELHYPVQISGSDAETILTLLKEQEAQRDYEASVEMTEYCERYEPTYNPEDGSM